MRTITQKSYISWLLLLTMSVVIFLGGCDSNPFDNQRFNQKSWIQNPWYTGKDKNTRLEMSEDLVKNHLKIGMERQQVRKLLGKPDTLETNYEDYYLGEYELILRFDKAGKLTKKEIVSI